jgi:hypothetical protein
MVTDKEKTEMNLETFLPVMAQNAQRIRILVEGISDEQARWKPGPDEWSILEVVNHLYDEERQDFRVRLDYILQRPGETWPRIDPQGWVTARKYNEQDLSESLQKFLAEREWSLNWLQDLGDVDWDTATETSFGQMRAGDMFAAWVAHDMLHMRQLVELHYAYHRQRVDPYSVQYAGDW